MSSTSEAQPFELPPLEPIAGVTVGEIERALATARSDAQEIREAARVAGREEGLQEARDVLEPAAAALSEALDALEVERGEMFERCEAAAVDLAIAIARQMLTTAVEVEPARIVDVVRGALRRLVERERVTILVHPDDLATIRAAAPGLAGELGGVEHCEVQAERRVARGGAIVRTAEGEVDATIESKLARVSEAITASLAGDPETGDDAFGD